MAETTEPQLDLDDFTLSESGSIRVVLPPRPVATDNDIDANLFEYVASAKKGSGIHCIADLDDEWVQANFTDLSTTAELRASIKHDLEKNANVHYDNYKFQKCVDALVERLQGEIPENVVAAAVDASRAVYEQRLKGFGMTKGQYLHEQRITEEQYEQQLRDDVLDQMKLNLVLDKLIEAQGTTVADDELTDYLTCDDPEAFMAEIAEAGRVEDARRAAMRVKVMRGVVADAVVEVDESQA